MREVFIFVLCYFFQSVIRVISQLFVHHNICHVHDARLVRKLFIFRLYVVQDEDLIFIYFHLLKTENSIDD